MKKNHYIIVIVVIFLGSLLLFWGSQAGENTISANDIYKLIEQGETQIDLTNLTDLEWTQVDVFYRNNVTKPKFGNV